MWHVNFRHVLYVIVFSGIAYQWSTNDLASYWSKSWPKCLQYYLSLVCFVECLILAAEQKVMHKFPTTKSSRKLKRSWDQSTRLRYIVVDQPASSWRCGGNSGGVAISLNPVFHLAIFFCANKQKVIPPFFWSFKSVDVSVCHCVYHGFEWEKSPFMDLIIYSAWQP
jgi:hypothetical protein